MNSFRLVLCLTGLLAYVIGRHFSSSEEKPVILTGPGQNLAGAELSLENIQPDSLVAKPQPPKPALLKANPEKNGVPAEEQNNLSASEDSAAASLRKRASHLTLNATATLR